MYRTSVAKKLAVVTVAGLAAFATMAEGSSSGDSSGSTGSDSAASPAATADSTAAADGEDTTEGETAVAGIGDPVRDGKFEFTVSKVKCGAKKIGSEYLNEKAQGQFCLVTMSVKNIGDEAQMFSASNQRGITSTGAEVEADSTASLYANEDGNSFLEDINPGNALESVVVVYDIAKDQDLVSVVLFDSMFSGGVEVSLTQ